MMVRRLTIDDLDVWYALRLRAITDHPTSFGPFPDEEAPKSEFAKRLENASAQNCTFGAFKAETLVGTAHFLRNERRKFRHWANIFSVYVVPEERGQGIARQLMQYLIEHARMQEGLEFLSLTVTEGNDAAQSLYISLGFISTGIEPRYYKVDDQYYDTEYMNFSLIDEG